MYFPTVKIFPIRTLSINETSRNNSACPFPRTPGERRKLLDCLVDIACICSARPAPSLAAPTAQRCPRSAVPGAAVGAGAPEPSLGGAGQFRLGAVARLALPPRPAPVPSRAPAARQCPCFGTVSSSGGWRIPVLVALLGLQLQPQGLRKGQRGEGIGRVPPCSPETSRSQVPVGTRRDREKRGGHSPPPGAAGGAAAALGRRSLVPARYELASARRLRRSARPCGSESFGGSHKEGGRRSRLSSLQFLTGTVKQQLPLDPKPVNMLVNESHILRMSLTPVISRSALCSCSATLFSFRCFCIFFLDAISIRLVKTR